MKRIFVVYIGTLRSVSSFSPWCLFLTETLSGDFYIRGNTWLSGDCLCFKSLPLGLDVGSNEILHNFSRTLVTSLLRLNTRDYRDSFSLNPRLGSSFILTGYRASWGTSTRTWRDPSLRTTFVNEKLIEFYHNFRGRKCRQIYSRKGKEFFNIKLTVIRSVRTDSF